MNILFLGETYRADAKTWIAGIEDASGSTVHKMEIPNGQNRFHRIFLFGMFLIKLLIMRFSKEYDIVLAERATSYGFFSLFVKAKIKVVAQQGITDAFPVTGFSGFYKRFFQKMVYKNVDLIHAWGYVMTKAMLDSGAKPNKIMVIPKGIDLERYPCRQIRNGHKPPMGIVTRSLTEVYRHVDILKAIALLKEQNIEFHCTIVGTGVLLETLKIESEALQIQERVTFLGRIDNHELPALLQESDLYLSMPKTEGVSGSLFEAMASGCFPIVTNLPGNRAFIQSGNNGILIEVGNYQQLANAIKTYIENSEKYQTAVLQNRLFIEEHADMKKNMKVIYQKYLFLLKAKQDNLES